MVYRKIALFGPHANRMRFIYTIGGIQVQFRRVLIYHIDNKVFIKCIYFVFALRGNYAAEGLHTRKS
jgi:hypothetical protein